jgi:hypothetical protein
MVISDQEELLLLDNAANEVIAGEPFAAELARAQDERVDLAAEEMLLIAQERRDVLKGWAAALGDHHQINVALLVRLAAGERPEDERACDLASQQLKRGPQAIPDAGGADHELLERLEYR